MSRRSRLPVALTVAGSDSGGGAGIQADLQTFAALGVHGACVVTCLTAQNPRAVLGVQPASRRMIALQLQAVFAELKPAAAKTGLLHSAEIIKAVAKRFRQESGLALVVDPVMVATSGARLLEPAARRALCRELLPLAALVTPNVPEAEALLECRLGHEDDLRQAARELTHRFGCATLLKGGHLPGTPSAVDVFYDGRHELRLTAPRVRGVRTHGTGCTYAAAITAYLARGDSLAAAVTKAKAYITQAIRRSHRIGRHAVLGWR
jgi:hydroxymethylpyrimidine/phosphomethylpyrimidine kinase